MLKKEFNNIAVVAYFNDNNELDENFLFMLEILHKIFDHIILVSTSPFDLHSIERYANVRPIIRPNIGYDFYSYKVGLSALSEIGEKFNSIFLINSSFFVTDNSAFKKTIMRMIDEVKNVQIVGLTDSKQFGWHLQSYLLAVNGSTINENWFKDFFDGVNPLNNKEEIIFKYEIGFSRKIRENSIEARSIYRPSVIQRIYAQSSWLVRVIKIKALKGLGIVRAIQYLSEINRTHFLAADIAGQFGIIKKELILSNPHKISLSSINLSKIKTVNHKNNNNSNKENTANLFLKYKKCASADVNLTSIKIAVVIHLYYADLLEEILEEISVISDPFDIYFTTPFEGDIPKIFNLASKVAESVNVFVFPNRGRDIGPFFALYADGVFDKYICVLKLHTKKSKYSAKGDEWRRLLYNKVIGGPIGARRICSTFEMNKVGIIGPRDYYLTHKKFWGANFSMVKKILMEAKLLEDGFDPNLGFFAGSMFWFSPKAFVSLKNLQHSCLEFEIENGKQDGTLAHALERVFCLVSRGAGYSVNSIECDKLYNVDHIDTLSNRVPVL